MDRRVRLPKVGAMRGDLRADVVVIGTGISGALIADALAETGRRVVLLDRRAPLRGSTPASTALLQYEIDTPLSQLSKEIGRTRAERIWRRSRLALDALRERARHLGINADLVNRDSLYLEGDVLNAGKLAEEGDARRRAGFEVSYLGAREVHARFGIRGRAALLGYDNLVADPRQLAAGFLHEAVRNGAKIYSPVEVIDVKPSRSGVDLVCGNGASVRAKCLVFATGYELPKGIPRKGNSVISTWAIATRPQPRALWPEECLIWEASDPYLYLRTTRDGRIICGGEDEAFEDEARRDALLTEKSARLSRLLLKMFPAIDAAPHYAWCGSFGASDTGTPTVGPVPRMPNCFAAMGYGGNGITFSMMAAQMLRAMIVGDGDPDADLVSFSRKF